jgi:AcrR family transcriptional regulator
MTKPGASVRSTYRHGNLRDALVSTAIELARAGGPDAVVLREVTRQVGVAPNAAYRHFADRQALLDAVSAVAQSRLAAAIESEQSAIPPSRDAEQSARSRLHAVGAAYLKFAQAEPGLFKTAFSPREDLSKAESSTAAGPTGLTPFQLLGAALDELVVTGAIPATRRPGAEFLAWSAVHGLAMLVIDGPLRAFDGAHIERLTSRLLAMVDDGL